MQSNASGELALQLNSEYGVTALYALAAGFQELLCITSCIRMWKT
jgi:hypothetical protein